ncbi:MAG: 5-bromo-4-chloroindolyl phosphate hydrolysis family protein [Oscillospiraceae bacterium]|nr:5-bromo-4-chloroindolyl phosphate hydrolysis family protein [Oscillospiraceae bacterium]
MTNRGSSLVAKKKGGAEMCVGAVLVLLPLVLLPYQPMSVLSLSIRDYLTRLLFMLAFVAGFYILSKGLRKRSLSQKLMQLAGLFDTGRRIPLEMAAELLKCNLNILVGDVRAMQRLKLVVGLYADLYRKELVYTGQEGNPPPPPPTDDVHAITLKEVHKKPATPLYAFGLVWAAYALFFPFYRPLDLAITLILALIAFFHISWTAPARVVIIKVPAAVPTPVETGNQQLDEMLRGVHTHLATLKALERSVDGKMKTSVSDLLQTTERIIEQVKKTPGKSSEMRQFFNYTLPTTINLLNNYQELRAQPVQGQNISAALTKIEGMTCTIVDAFHRQLDALFADQSLNIAVEIEVMNQMFKQSGSMKDIYADFGGNKNG